MTRPRVPLGLEASRTTLNRVVCAELGRAAKEARTGRGLSVSDVSSRLILSPAQVAALEEVNPEAFYGADFYANALKKYLRYLDLPDADAARVIVGPSLPADVAPPFKRRHQPLEGPPLRTERSVPFRPAVVAVVLAASAVAGWWLLAARRAAPPAPSTSERSEEPKPPTTETVPSSPDTTPPTSDTATPAVSPEPDPSSGAVSAVSAALSPVMQAASLTPENGAQGAGDRLGSVTVGRPTWVFVRYADNSTDEQGIGPGQAFTFRAQPVYVAVGAAEGTTLTVAGRAVDTAPFITNGQIRMSKTSLGTIVAAR